MYALIFFYHLLLIILATPIRANIQRRNQSLSSMNSGEKGVCSRELRRLWKRVCIDEDYEKENPPFESSNKVYIFIEHLDINEINEDENRFDISILDSMNWFDNRIALGRSQSNIIAFSRNFKICLKIIVYEVYCQIKVYDSCYFFLSFRYLHWYLW